MKNVRTEIVAALQAAPQWPQGIYRLAHRVENPSPSAGSRWFDAPRFHAGEVYKLVHDHGLRLAPHGASDFIDVGRQPLLLRALLDELSPITSLVELSVELDRLGISVMDLLCALVSRGWQGADLGALLGEARMLKRSRRLQNRWGKSSLASKVFTDSIDQKLKGLDDRGAEPVVGISQSATQAARPSAM